MLADFVQSISDLARKTTKVHVEVSEELGAAFISQDGTYERVEIPPARRRSDAGSLMALIDAAKDEDMAKRSGYDPEVWHGPHSVQLLLNRGDRRDDVTLAFDHSDRWSALGTLRSGQSFSVPDAIRFLRFDLTGTGVEPIVTALRKVNFQRRGDGSVTTEHGRESLGRAVEAEVQQRDSIPESFRVRAPVTCTPGLLVLSNVEVEIGIHLHPQTEQVEFRVLADQLEIGEATFHGNLDAWLKKELPDVPVFAGTP